MIRSSSLASQATRLDFADPFGTPAWFHPDLISRKLNSTDLYSRPLASASHWIRAQRDQLANAIFTDANTRYRLMV